MFYSTKKQNMYWIGMIHFLNYVSAVQFATEYSVTMRMYYNEK